MSLSVQERDRSGGMLDSVIPSKGFHGALNGKVDFVRSRKSHYSQVPDQDTLDVGWNDNGHLDMQGQNSKCSKSQWQCGGWNSGQIIEDGVTPCKPVPPKTHASLEDVVNDGGPESQQHPVQHNIDLMDDEMVSWLQPNLQYPLDASLERTFQSDFFSEHSDSTQLLKEFGAVRTMRPPLSGSPVSDANLRAATAEQAMMLGAGRAAGLLPQAGVEVFSKVRTLHSVPPTSSMTRWPQPVNGSNMCATTTMTSAKTSSPSTSNPMLPPKMQPVAQHQSPSPNRPGSMNFSHFSRPAAIVKASLHSLAGSLHPIAAPLPNGQRFKPQMGRPIAEACTSTGSSIAESTTAAQEVKVQLERDQNGMEDSRWQSAPNLSPAKDLASGGECKSATPADQETCRLSGITSDAVLANSSKGVSHVNQHPDIQEPTITSSSGGYGTSAEPPKEASTSTKRKSSERDDTECQSEDGEDESVDTKKPAAGRGNTTKRSRAAEVHNQSERRRRDRINEKMRALQELIPNSNKTDKASMLDEAIEYLKMLQVQLQMMSIRTGMTLPPMVVPSGMQPHMQMPQMPQMAAMPSMGMGMGMGMVPMGLGMGMMDMQQGRAVMPMQSHGGPAMNGNLASTSSLGDVHDYRYQTPVGVMDSYNAYLARQHQPMQMNPQTIGIDKYNAYMLQQHQLQQQQHQQQQQQQQHQQLQPHQQHQHHQQAPNMNGGPPH